jgi:hypothetical protein
VCGDNSPFTESGVLPKGDYPVTFQDLRDSLLVVTDLPDWDTAWRLHLVNQAENLVRQLWQVGVAEIFLDGSFVEDKVHPNDIDGYFACDLMELASGELQQKLNALDPYKVWTWDPATRRAYRGYVKKQLPMWHRYRVELYPHVGQLSGILDEFGYQQLFPAAFRKQRQTFKPKGLIKLVKGGL